MLDRRRHVHEIGIRHAHLTVQLARALAVYNATALGHMPHKPSAATIDQHRRSVADAMLRFRFARPDDTVIGCLSHDARSARDTLASMIRAERQARTDAPPANPLDLEEDPLLQLRRFARHLRTLKPILADEARLRFVFACEEPVRPEHLAA